MKPTRFLACLSVALSLIALTGSVSMADFGVPDTSNQGVRVPNFGVPGPRDPNERLGPSNGNLSNFGVPDTGRRKDPRLENFGVPNVGKPSSKLGPSLGVPGSSSMTCSQPSRKGYTVYVSSDQRSAELLKGGEMLSQLTCATKRAPGRQRDPIRVCSNKSDGYSVELIPGEFFGNTRASVKYNDEQVASIGCDN